MTVHCNHTMFLLIHIVHRWAGPTSIRYFLLNPKHWDAQTLLLFASHLSSLRRHWSWEVLVWDGLSLVFLVTSSKMMRACRCSGPCALFKRAHDYEKTWIVFMSLPDILHFVDSVQDDMYFSGLKFLQLAMSKQCPNHQNQCDFGNLRTCMDPLSTCIY